MLASNLELHPNIISYNTGGSSRLKISNEIKDSAGRLFENGVGYVKGDIRFRVFDEVHPKYYSSKQISIALIRDFNSINKSIKSMYKKLHGFYIPFIRKSPFISQKEYEKLIQIGQRDDVLAISTELFIKHPQYHYDLISNFLGIEKFPMREKVFSNGCNCGHEFKVIKTNDLSDNASLLVKEQEYLFCENHNSVLCAPGGFNPYVEMDENRISKDFKHTISSFNREFNNPI